MAKRGLKKLEGETLGQALKEAKASPVARVAASDVPKIQITVVRNRGGGVRCVYVGNFRVVGAKPYVSENLPHEFFEADLADVEEACAFARKYPEGGA